MKGIWFTEQNKIELLEEDTPVSKRDTLLLKTIYSGLSNGTERNKLVGGNYSSGSYPDRIGYQHVSKVIEVGSEITNYQVGDIVFTGTFPGHVPYYTAREDDLIVKLPNAMVRPSTALMGVASVSMHDVRLANVHIGDRVLIVGAGLIGLFALQASLASGAEVVIVDRNADRIQIAQSLGADRITDNTSEQAWPILKNEKPFSVCLECSGGDVLDHIIGKTWNDGILTKNARLVFVAGRFQTTFNFNAASSCRLQTYSTAHFVQDDLEQVLRLALKKVINLDAVLRDVVPIEKAISAYETLRDNKRKLLGTVFDWTRNHGLG